MSLQEAKTVAKAADGDHVRCEAAISHGYIKRLLGLCSSKKLIAGSLRKAMDLGLEARDSRFGEKLTQRQTTPSMEVMVSSAKSRPGRAISVSAERSRFAPGGSKNRVVGHTAQARRSVDAVVCFCSCRSKRPGRSRR